MGPDRNRGFRRGRRECEEDRDTLGGSLKGPLGLVSGVGKVRASTGPAASVVDGYRGVSPPDKGRRPPGPGRPAGVGGGPSSSP